MTRGEDKQNPNKATKDLRFGLIVSAQFVPFPEAVKQCQYIEELGYDSIWLGDHFHNRIRESDPWFDLWTTLAALATQTKKLRLGTLVATFSYRNPALVAKQALSVEHISEGRLELGLGAGVYPEDHKMAGVDFWSPKERVQRFREAVQIVDQMLRNEVTTFVGQYYRVEEAVCNPDPIQKPRPPITIAAFGNKMIKIAAEFADSWNTLAYSATNFRTGKPPTAEEALEETKRQSDLLDQYCNSLGRDPSEIRRSLLTGWMPDTPTDSVDAFIEFVEKYRAVGITEFIFYWLPDEYQDIVGERIRMLDTNMVERIAQDGIPKLKSF